MTSTPRFAALLVFAALLATTTPGQSELRAVWVARDGLTSRTKIQSTLDQLLAANCNCVCVNVWSRGYTIHPSDVLAAACGVTQDPAYLGRDPLAEFVFEAHRRGIEVEAWFEYGFMFGWSGWYAGANGRGPVLNANPSWVGQDNTGNTQVSDGAGGFFTWASHEHPAVRQFLIDLVVEVVRRYDVDGVQFDRCRYPSTSFGYDPTTSAAYLAATGNNPPTNVNNAAWKRWRADQLNAFHMSLYYAAKAVRSSVRVTDAPTVWPSSYDSFLQDWPQWVTASSLDLVYPQVYRTTVAQYTTTLDQQLATLPMPLRSKVAPGIRAITGTPTSEVLGMVAANRARNLPGHVFWYAEGLYDDLPSLQATYFQAAVAVPGQPAGWRPPMMVVEENAPTTTVTPGFLPVSLVGSSGGTARMTLPSSGPTEQVVYSLSVPTAGLWTLCTSVPNAAGLATGAPFEFVHAGGTTVLAVDETTAAPSGFRELATFWLPAGATTLTVRGRSGQSVVADAVGLLASRLPGGSIGTFGTGMAGSAGVLGTSMHGRAGLGGTLYAQGNRAAPDALLVLGLGFQGTTLPLFGGTLLVVPAVLVPGLADALGTFTTPVAVPWSPSLIGTGLWAQALAFDAAGPEGIVLSNGVAATIQ
ncbi:MAG: family 10 glycosylhydrolase [Planctomycetes bacterium]|nr:family 10 glycosylhydrolase [Planctomycetota bacterium]